MAEALKPSVRASGGTPNGFPDYRPINKLPKHELKAAARKLLTPVLYQVWVDDRKRGTIPVAPKVSSAVASGLAYAISEQIRLGREKDWSNPTVLVAI